MARVFTTTFSHYGETYTAVIYQIDSYVTIYVPDETLHGLLPDGRISFNSQQGIRIDTLPPGTAQELISSILSAVETQYGEVLRGKKEQHE